MKKLITMIAALAMLANSPLIVSAEDGNSADEPEKTVLQTTEAENTSEELNAADEEKAEMLKQIIEEIRSEKELPEFVFDEELNQKAEENKDDIDVLKEEYEILSVTADQFDYDTVHELLCEEDLILSEEARNIGFGIHTDAEGVFCIQIISPKAADIELKNTASSEEETVTESEETPAEPSEEKKTETDSSEETEESEETKEETAESEKTKEETDESEEAKEDAEETAAEEAEDAVDKKTALKSAAEETAEEETAPVTVYYSTHLSDIGWTGTVTDGSETRSGRIEAFRIYTKLPENELSVNYQAHVQNIGWMNTVSANAAAGTTGRSLQVEAIRISLSGEKAGLYKVQYRTYVTGQGWTGWSENGKTSGTEGMSLAIRQIQVKIVPVNGTQETAEAEKIDIAFKYSAHVQNIGWQGERTTPAMAGTTGRSLRLEAMRVNLTDDLLAMGNISATAHVQNVGWMSPVGNGGTIGTTGRSLRLEAVKLSLTGELAKKFNIYYRAHVQNIGWQGWVSNGAVAGTSGRSLAIEAMEIQIVPKDEAFLIKNPAEEKKTGFHTEIINGANAKVYYDDNGNIVKRSFKKDQVYYQVNEVTGAIIHEQKLFTDKIYMHGIDISEHNGNIDLTQYQNGFVIIRIGWWTNPDTKAIRNMDLCDKYNIPYGVYLYDYTTEVEDAVKEAEFTLNMIKGRNIRCGVWFDMEDDGWRARNGVAPDNPRISELCKAYCDRIAQAGYHVGIYASYSWFENYIKGCDKYDKWVAHWGSNDGKWNNDLSAYAPLHQYTSNGGLDQNVMYVDPYYFR